MHSIDILSPVIVAPPNTNNIKHEIIISCCFMLSQICSNIGLLLFILNKNEYKFLIGSYCAIDMITLIYYLLKKQYVRNNKLLFLYNNSITQILLNRVAVILTMTSLFKYQEIIIVLYLYIFVIHEVWIYYIFLMIDDAAKCNYMVIRICMLIIAIEILILGLDSITKILLVSNAVFSLVIIGYLHSKLFSKSLVAVLCTFYFEFIACSYLYINEINYINKSITIYIFNVPIFLTSVIIFIDSFYNL
jgi:hypothetical protein